MKLDRYDVIFIIMIAFAVLARVYLFDYPLAEGGGQGSRDYLVANHILAHHEFPLTGPNTIVHNHLSSPLYYYFITLFLLVKDSILFMGAVFVFFQILTLFIVYLIVKTISSTSALIAVVLFAFSSEIMRQSGNIWPNYAMQPFVNLGFLLLFLSHIKRNYLVLLSALFVVFFASTLHLSALAVLPLFLVATVWILKKQNKRPIHYAVAVLSSLIPLILFYVSPLIYITKNNFLGGVGALFLGQGVRGSIAVGSITEFLENFANTLRVLANYFLIPGNGPSHLGINTAVIAVLILFSLVYFFKKKDVQKKYIIVAALFVTQQVVFVSLLSKAHADIYLVPILGLFAILIAYIIHAALGSGIVANIGKIIFVFAITQIASSNFYLFSEKEAFKNSEIINSATDALTKDIFRFQKTEGFADIDFFQIRSFRTGNLSVAKEVLWVPIERKLDRKFTRVSGSGATSSDNNSAEYIFLACYDHGAHYTRDACKAHFLSIYVNYEIVKETFSENKLSIYATKEIAVP